MKTQYDVVMTLGSHVEPDNTLSAEGRQRVEATVRALEDDVAPYAVMTGLRPFRHADVGLQPVADAMADYAVNVLGTPADRVLTQAKSLDTVGDALFTKRDVMEPYGWRRALVLSSESHVDRGVRISRHVMGGTYIIEGSSAGNYLGEQNRQRLQEFAGNALTKMLLGGIEPGDDARIAERLFKIVPGYEQRSAAKRAISLLGALPHLLA
jgi:hypothetical protein